MAVRVFGFSNVAKSALLDDEAQALREAVERRIDGATRAGAAAHVNSLGFVGTLGSAFTGKTLGKLFRNPAIAGLESSPDGTLADAGHPGIITPHQFAQLQALDEAETAKREDARKAAPQPDYEYAFAQNDLVVCGLCGASQQGLRTSAGYPGYCCSAGPRADRPGDCGKVRISAELLEDHLGEQIAARLLEPGTQKALETARTELEKQLVAAKTQLEAITEGLGNLGGMVLRHEITAASAAKAQAEGSQQQKALRRRIRILGRAVATPVSGDIDELVKWWNSAGAVARAGLAMLMLHRVDVHPGGRGVRTLKPGRVVLWWRDQPAPPPTRRAA
ncbi:recombinase zinc beta ribbon domain-containing protein [Kitasatospora sp. NPDC058478]|uniref:recombinase zinc beta ribbon domain-containing protein n=1 Tax=unclassified Kitasatospora TaxID=2633591 RepID=UPI00364FA62B